MTEAPPRKLIVSKPNEADRMVRLGVLEFGESNHPTLSIQGSGPAVDRLKQDWQEVSQQSKLMWKTTVPGEENGEKVTRIVGQMVRPGEDNYVYAVLNTLERSYGYRVDFDR